MKHCLILIILSIMSIFPTNGAEPDFSKPVTVIEQSKKAIAALEKSHSTDAAAWLTAYGNMFRAEASIDEAKIFAQPAVIQKLIENHRFSDGSLAMLLAYEAHLYKEIYNHGWWTYNDVDAPLEPYPAELSKWSGLQFRTRIMDLLRTAQAVATDQSLAPYKSLLGFDEVALKCVPTTYDFVALQLAEVYQNLGHESMPREFAAIVDAMVKHCKPGTMPYFYWRVKQIQNIVDKDEDDRKEADLKALYAMYKEYEGTEDALYVLDKLADELSEMNAQSVRDALPGVDMVSILRAAMAKYPKSVFYPSLANCVQVLTRPTVRMTFDDMAYPGRDFNVKVNYEFVTKLELDIYPVPDDFNRWRSFSTKAKKPLQRVKVPDAKGSGTVSVTLNLPIMGKYLIVPVINGKRDDDTHSILTVTSFLPFCVNSKKNVFAVTADFVTGAPVADVGIYTNMYDGKNRFIGKSDKEGFAECHLTAKELSDSEAMAFEYKGCKLGFDRSIRWERLYSSSDTLSSVKVFTPRAIYHPGETLEWCAVSGEKERKGESRVVKACKYDVYLVDASGKEVSKISCKTDDYGYMSGSFELPTDGLTGRYTISVMHKGVPRGYWNSNTATVMVSDFKAPTMELVDSKVFRDSPSEGAVTVKGCLRTFSGMPVSEASVTAKIKTHNRFWWWFKSEELGELTAKTDAEGNYEFVVPATMTNESDSKDFVAQIVATAPSGEAVESRVPFSLGKPYALMVDVPKVLDMDSENKLVIQAKDAQNQDVEIAVKWNIVEEGSRDVVASGDVVTGKPFTLPVSTIPAGVYTLQVTPADTAMADIYSSSTFSTYSIQRNMVPAGSDPLFVPVTTVMREKNTVTVTVGTTEDEIYVYAFAQEGQDKMVKLLSKLGKGFSKIKIDMGKFTSEDVDIMLATVRNGKTYTTDITVIEPVEPVPVLETVSFRDKIVPGTPGTVTFRFAKGDKTLKDFALIATAYNKALNALTPPNWPGLFSKPKRRSLLGSSFTSVHSENGKFELDISYLEVPNILWPEFSSLFGPRYLGGVRYSAVGSNMLLAESCEYDGCEMSVKCAPTAVADKAAAAEEDKPQKEEVEFRDAEVLQAFWAPMVKSGKDGTAEITFKVPNANTTWQMHAFAWNKALDNALLTAEMLANKPVMVTTNVPRFLRQGDKAVMTATVFNATEEAASIKCTLEMFDPNGGAVLATKVINSEIAANGSTLVSLEVDAGSTLASVGFRVSASNGTFTDGEQVAMPVLTSEAVVRESVGFVIPAKYEGEYKLDFEPHPASSNVLMYNFNPIWALVKTLRGNFGASENSSTALVSQLYSAYAAKMIVKANPALDTLIATWKKTPAAITSMLQQNEELKQFMLAGTPWTLLAENNSMRMEMLAQILDPTAIDSRIKDLSKALDKLRTREGGFAWGPWDKNEASLWATESVLLTAGLIQSLAGMPEDNFMELQKAYDWLASKILERKTKYYADTEFALISAFMPKLKQNAGAKKIIAETVKELSTKWKDADLLGKANAAIIFAANGKKELALTVTESISQFAVRDEVGTFRFPNVRDMRVYASLIHALHSLGVDAALVDGLRQWVILQTQVTDDLSVYNPDYIIASVMDGLKGVDASNFTLSVNGKAVDFPREEIAAGYVKMPLSSEAPSRIGIVPVGGVCSYGSVSSSWLSEARDVQPKAGEDLSISRRYLVERNGMWEESTQFERGQRVRVQLCITAARAMDYITVKDERAATFEPVDQLPGYVWDGPVWFYRENRDASTNLFVTRMPKGTFYISYDMTASTAGTFSSGIATIQSQYAPELSAHSGGTTVKTSAVQ